VKVIVAGIPKDQSQHPFSTHERGKPPNAAKVQRWWKHATNPVDALLHASVPRLYLFALVLLLPRKDLQHEIQTILTHAKPRHCPTWLRLTYVPLNKRDKEIRS
jgi:hypothetical protein